MLDEHRLTIVDSYRHRASGTVAAICVCGDDQRHLTHPDEANRWFIEHLRTRHLAEAGRDRGDVLAAVALYLSECGYDFPRPSAGGFIDETSTHVTRWFMERDDANVDELVASMIIGAGMFALAHRIDLAECIYRAADRDRMAGPVGAR